MSQQDLASELDVSRQTVYKWEQGITSPNISKLPTIAKLFNISVDVLLHNNISEDNLRKSIFAEKSTPGSNNRREKVLSRSMLDYLLMMPIGLGFGIGLFMYFCFGAMLVGFLGFFTIISCCATFYGFLMFFANYIVGAGAIIYCFVFIFMGLGLIYPMYLLFLKWKNMYVFYSHKIIKYMKSFNWKGLL